MCHCLEKEASSSFSFKTTLRAFCQPWTSPSDHPQALELTRELILCLRSWRTGDQSPDQPSQNSFKEPSCSTDNSLRVKPTTSPSWFFFFFFKCTEEGNRGRRRVQRGASPPGYLQVCTFRREISDYPLNHLWVRELNNRQGGVTAVCAFLKLKIIWSFIICMYANTM